MSRRKNWAIWTFVIVYCTFIIGGCLALSLDNSGTLGKWMTKELFDIPFFFTTLRLTPWKLMGAVGALMFGGRWLVQMYYARRAGKPVTPITFWIMSVIGSHFQLIYFVYSPKQDMVGVLSNLVPSFVAGYNLYLELKHRAKYGDGQGGIESKSTRVQKKPDEDKKDPPPNILPHQAKGPLPLVQIATQEPAAGE